MDCLPVTYLHRPIHDSWSMNTLCESGLTSLFTSIDSPHLLLSLLPMVVKDISDDEGSETHHVLDSFFAAHGDHQPLVTASSKIERIGFVDKTGEIVDSKSSEVDQSCIVRVQARRRRNRTRNLVLRPFRDRHVLNFRFIFDLR